MPDIILPDEMEYLKFREKDNPASLKWDEINKTDYNTWTSTATDASFINSARQEVSSSTTFGKIKANVDWLEKNSKKSYSLNINKFRQDQKMLKDIRKQMDELYKLPNAMNITNLKADTATIFAAKEKKDNNERWIKAISKDIYVDETVKVLGKMIVEANLAKKD